jgi:hypothetical protein
LRRRKTQKTDGKAQLAVGPTFRLATELPPRHQGSATRKSPEKTPTNGRFSARAFDCNIATT